MSASMTKPSLSAWQPSREEVEAIVAEMRPVIDALAARERERLSAPTVPSLSWRPVLGPR